MTPLITSSRENRDNKFVVKQAEGSAHQGSSMVRDEMLRGNFCEVEARVSRIEEVVRQGCISREQELNLLLLAAKFLEGAGQTKKAFRLVGRLVADSGTLPGEIYLAVGRFRTRLLLNVGQVEGARAEIACLERDVLLSEGAMGETKETVSADTSFVTLPTWLLTAEV